MQRRDFLRLGGCAGAAAAFAAPAIAHAGMLPIPNPGAAAVAPAPALAAPAIVQPSTALVAEVRKLSFRNLHTGETLTAAYWEKGAYLSDALGAMNRLLRDHRTGDVHPIDPALFDLLDGLQRQVGAVQPYQVISGYRSPKSNAGLHARSSGVATRSLHMDGKAMDVRLDGVNLAKLRDTAHALGKGGVGYYPSDNFVHVDTGRVRRW